MEFGFNFEMDFIWQMLSMIVIILFFTNNYLISYYRDKEEKHFFRRVWKPVKFHCIVLFVFLAIAGIIFMWMGSVNLSRILI